jgi:hypothetical protein
MGMLESIKSLNGWHHKDYKVIYRLWKQIIMKQNELNGEPKFTMTIRLGGKLLNHWNTNKR